MSQGLKHDASYDIVYVERQHFPDDLGWAGQDWF